MLALSVLIGSALSKSILAKPKITSKVGKAFSYDYMLQWTYASEQNGRVQYQLTIRNKETGKSTVATTWLPFERIVGQGRLGIQIEAIAPDSTNVKSEEVEVELYNDSIDRIQATKELVVAIHADNNEGLFCYNTAGGYEGFDVDLVKKIRDKLQAKYGINDLRVRLVFEPWPAIIETPNSYEVDFAIASISITPDRERVVLFSNPYWETEIAVLQPRAVNTATKPFFSLKEFSGLGIGVHQGTTEVELANKLKVALRQNLQIVPASNNLELFSMLSRNAVNAVLYDYDRARTELEKHPSWSARKIDYEDLNRNHIDVKRERYGIAFAQVNTRLRGDVNEVLEDSNLIRRMIEDRIAKLSNHAED